MTADGVPGSKNQPQFLGSGAPATAADANTISNYGAKVGNRRADPAAARAAAAGKDLWDGLEWDETDTGIIYRRRNGAWGVLHIPDTGNVALSLTSGWSTTAASHRVKNGFVSLNGRLSATAGAGAVFATLPVGARPGVEIVTLAYDASGTVWHTLIIGADGSLNLFTKSAAVTDLRLGAVAPFPVA